MLDEARAWTGGRVLDATLRTLLTRMRLTNMGSVTNQDEHDGANSFTFEAMILRFTMPASPWLPDTVLTTTWWGGACGPLVLAVDPTIGFNA